MKNDLNRFAVQMIERAGTSRATRVLGRVALCLLLSATSSVLHAQSAGGGRAQKSGQQDLLQDGPPIWDYDHDGVYTCDEWKRYMDQLFTLADRNHDGYLSKSEFATIRRAERTLKDADPDYFDDNRDGKVSRSEFVDKPSLFITQYDKNGDCRVTQAELNGSTTTQPAADAGTGRHGGGGMGGGGGGGMGGGQGGGVGGSPF